MPKHSKLLLSGIVWVAAYLRFPALFVNHFHADEALFSSWARLIAVWRDPMLANQLVDKPPLLFYLQSLFFPLLGAVEWASRLPNFVASLLLVPLIAVLGWRFYHSRGISLLAALFVALSPTAIQYSATAFTDPLLATLLILALLLITGQPKPVWSGLVFGLAVTTKYQAWLFLPLLFGLAWLQNWGSRHWRRWLIGFLPPVLILFIWEFLRMGTPVIWSNQLNNFGGLRMIHAWELMPRLLSWIAQWQTVYGSAILLLLFAFAVLVLLINGFINRSKTSLVDLLLLLYLLAYTVVHWLLAVPVWDRYLLPIIPLAALLLARAIVVLVGWIDDWIRAKTGAKMDYVRWLLTLLLILGILVFLQGPAAKTAQRGQWPTGGQATADQGAWQIAELLADEPYGTVLYDHWYSWHWRYHFFDTGVYVSWFPHPSALVEDLQAFGDRAGSRYIVLPDTAVARPIQRAINDAGFKLDEEFRTDYQPGMILYRVQR